MEKAALERTAKPLQLTISTLSGQEIVIDGLTESSTLMNCLQQVARILKWPVFTIRLLVDSGVLEGYSVFLFQLGICAPGATATVIRVPATLDNYNNLFTGLVHALKRGNDAQARELVNLGAGFDSRGCLMVTSGNNMLHVAIRQGFVHLSLHMIQLGVSPDDRNDSGRPALAQAAIKGFARVVSALLDAKADATQRDSNGRTAFFYALGQGNDSLAAKLFSASSLEVEEANAGIFSPLVNACTDRGLLLTRAALLAAGAEDLPQLRLQQLQKARRQGELWQRSLFHSIFRTISSSMAQLFSVCEVSTAHLVLPERSVLDM